MDVERPEQDPPDRHASVNPDQFRAVAEWLAVGSAIFAAPTALKDGTELVKKFAAGKAEHPLRVAILDAQRLLAENAQAVGHQIKVSITNTSTHGAYIDSLELKAARRTRIWDRTPNRRSGGFMSDADRKREAEYEQEGSSPPIYIAPEEQLRLHIELIAKSDATADELLFKCSLLNSPGSEEDVHRVPILLRRL
jgi:hypothetical protein